MTCMAIFVVLFNYYVKLPHPDTKMLAAMKYLANNTTCSPQELYFYEVRNNVVKILKGERLECPKNLSKN